MTALIIYIIVAVIFTIAVSIKWYKEEVNPRFWEIFFLSLITLIFAPILIAYLAFDLCKKIYYKNRPAPIAKKDRKSASKDLVYDGNRKVSIARFNKRHQTNFTLADVYGKKYLSSVTPEEIALFEKYDDEIRVGHTGNVSETQINILNSFAEFLIKGNSELVVRFIDQNTNLFIYHKGEHISSVSEIINFFTKKAQKDARERRTITIQECPFTRTISLLESYDEDSDFDYINESGGFSRYLLFRFVDGKIVDIVYTPEYFNDLGRNYKVGLSTPPFKKETLSKGVETRIAPKFEMLPCMHCGRQSIDLNWYSFYIPESKHLLFGRISVCPHCHKQVQFVQMAAPDREGMTPLTTVSGYGLKKPFLRGLYYFIYSHPLKELDGKYTKELDDTLEIEDKMSRYWHRHCGTDDEAKTLRGVVEDFVTLKFHLLSDENKKQLIESYENASHDGIVEANNNLGIFFYNYSEGETEKGINYFQVATQKGVRTAMHNLFAALWGNGKYEAAVQHLEYVSELEDPSIHCLWNLAYLYLRGEDEKNNPLTKNIDKAKIIFRRLSEMYPTDEEHSEKMIKESGELLNHIEEGYNEYSCKAAEYYDLLLQLSHKEENISPSRLLSTLNELSLPQGLELAINMEFKKHSSGDISKLYVKDSYNKEYDLLKTIKVKNSALGAWQLYLINSSSHYLPTYWHGAYMKRVFIYSKKCVEKTPAEGYDFNTFDLEPKVEFNILENGSRSIVSACYWNDWKGLVREKYEITIENSKLKKMEYLGYDVIFEYDCHVMF